MEEGLQSAALTEATAGLTQAATDFIAGGVGGMAGVVAGAPLDTVRIRQQQAGQLQTMSAMIRNIATGEGFKALFRGMSYPLCTAAVQNAATFNTFGLAGRHLLVKQGGTEPLSLQHVFWAGCFSGIVQTGIVTPVDLLKIRLQLQTSVPGSSAYLGPLGMLRAVIRAEGVGGLFRGLTITAIRDIPSYGIYFACFEGTREHLQPGSRRAGGKSNPWAVWAAGGVAGAISWLFVYPFDVMKSRIQATSAKGSAYRGWLHCAGVGLRDEGFRVFFKGLSATLTRAFLVNGAIFTAYEIVHDALQANKI